MFALFDLSHQIQQRWVINMKKDVASGYLYAVSSPGTKMTLSVISLLIVYLGTTVVFAGLPLKNENYTITRICVFRFAWKKVILECMQVWLSYFCLRTTTFLWHMNKQVGGMAFSLRPRWHHQNHRWNGPHEMVELSATAPSCATFYGVACPFFAKVYPICQLESWCSMSDVGPDFTVSTITITIFNGTWRGLPDRTA